MLTTVSAGAMLAFGLELHDALLRAMALTVTDTSAGAGGLGLYLFLADSNSKQELR